MQDLKHSSKYIQIILILMDIDEQHPMPFFMLAEDPKLRDYRQK